VNQWVAEQVRAALAMIPSTSAPPAKIHRETSDGVQSTRGRLVLLVLAAVIGCAGVTLLFLGPIAFVIGMGLLALASLPIGIALGTQPKKFWV